ncbi:MAG TPA: hypothetical protein VFI58_07440 [Xanthobacteraceae bacterium]|jgi:hypothetical protein|nr:hypothetical protein [Xanthobacteraceae bacterium]
MTSKSKTKSGAFRYQKRSREQFLRNLRTYQFDEDIVRAYRGDTGPLCDYLKNPDLPLSWDHREMLAELIHRRIGRKKRGRPRGSDPVPNPGREAEQLIVYQVRQLKSRLYGNNKVPRGRLNALIEEVCQQNADRFDGLGGDINMDNIRRELKRGAKQKTRT